MPKQLQLTLLIQNGLTLVKNVVYLMMHSLSAFMKMVASIHREV